MRSLGLDKLSNTTFPTSDISISCCQKTKQTTMMAIVSCFTSVSMRSRGSALQILWEDKIDIPISWPLLLCLTVYFQYPDHMFNLIHALDYFLVQLSVMHLELNQLLLYCCTSIRALPNGGVGGLNSCKDGLGHLFREEFSKFKVVFGGSESWPRWFGALMQWKLKFKWHLLKSARKQGSCSARLSLQSMIHFAHKLFKSSIRIVE